MRPSLSQTLFVALMLVLMLAGCPLFGNVPPSPVETMVSPPISNSRIGFGEELLPQTYGVQGAVYRQDGTLIMDPLSVRVACPNALGQTIATASTDQGSYSLSFELTDNAVIEISGPGFRSLSRSFPPRGYYVHQPWPLSPDATATCNFGGPTTSADPDAPVFYLGPTGAAERTQRAATVGRVATTRVASIVGELRFFGYEGAGLAVLPAGNFAVLERSAGKVWSVSQQGNLSALAGANLPGNSPETQLLMDGVGVAARFWYPLGLAADAQGNLLVADSGNAAIRRVTSSGQVTTLAGERSYGYADGQAATARFFNPMALAVDSHGNVLVADTDNHCIRRITPEGMVTTLAGATESGHVDAVARDARFGRVTGIAVDGMDNAYVADNGWIRKVSPQGRVTTVYGNYVVEGSDIVTPAVLMPETLAVDHQGTIYVSSSVGPNRGYLYRITPTGEVGILAGNGTFGSIDGSSSEATFQDPRSLTVGPDGRIFVLEPDRIRILSDF